MTVLLRDMMDVCVTIGSLTLHLSEYKLVGGCAVHEQGTADGKGTMTAHFPKGTKLTLKGRLAPSVDPASAAVAVDRAVHEKTPVSFSIRNLICSDAFVIGFTLTEGTELPEITLLFYLLHPLADASEVGDV